MSDRLELEAELERLQAELTKVKKEKAQQRRKIHQLRLEQVTLCESAQKPSSSSSQEALQSLQKTVLRNKEEHTRARVEYGKTKSQYQQLKQTVVNMTGPGAPAPDMFLSSDDEASLGAEEEEFVTDDFLNGLWGQPAVPKTSNNASMQRLADAFDSNAGFGDLTSPSSNSPDHQQPLQYQQLGGLDDDEGDSNNIIDPKYKARLAKKKKTKKSNRLNFESLGSSNTSDDATVMTKDSVQMAKEKQRNAGRSNNSRVHDFDDDGTVMTKDSLQITKEKQRNGGRANNNRAHDFDDEGTVMTRDSLSLARAKMSDSAGAGAGDDDAVTVTTKDSLQMAKERTATRKKQRKPTGLGNFLASGGKAQSGGAGSSGKSAQGKSLGDHFERLNDEPPRE